MRLPALATDLDRIIAARLTAKKLERRLFRYHKRGWHHFINSVGGITSEKVVPLSVGASL